MRLRMRYFLLLGLLALITWQQSDSLLQTGQSWLAELRARRFHNEATRYRTFLLDREHEIEFQLPANPRTLRVFTNAAMDRVEPLRISLDDPRPGHRYSVCYELLSPTGEVLESAEYHFRARVNQYRNPETGEIFTATMFDKSTAIPAATRTLQLPMERVAGRADRIRLRLVSADPVIESVVARVFCCRERSGYNNPTTWHRLSHERRELLARASVYTSDLLGPYERRNLLRWRWSALAPMGVESVDFQRRTLYVINEVDGEEITPTESVNGITFDAAQHGVVPLPPKLGMAHLQLFKRPSDERLPAEPDSPCKITVRWFGLGLDQRFEKSLTIDNFGDIVDVPCDGGILVIESTHRAIANVSWREQLPDEGADVADEGATGVSERVQLDRLAAPTTIEVDRRYLRAMLIDERKSVTYDVAHLPHQATPVRISVRGFATNDERARDNVNDPPQVDWSVPPVRWQFLGEDGEVMRDGALAIDPTPSQFDRINMAPGRRLVTEPTEYFFNVPANVAAIRLTTDQDGALVSLATRPSGLRRDVLVPEEYNALVRADVPHRTWFVVRPRKHLQAVEQNETISIQIQTRPPEDDPLLLAGEYDWQSFEPAGAWVGRTLVVPRMSKPPRPESLISSYYKLVPNRSHTLSLLSEPLSEWVRPRLLYFRPAPGSGTREVKDQRGVNGKTGESPGSHTELSVLIDGEVVHRATLRSSNGEIELPELPAHEWLGDHDVRIETGHDVTVLMNYCHAPDRPSFLKRTAQRFRDGSLRFSFDKQHDEELLIVKLYRPLPQSNRVRLRADLELNRTATQQPQLAWTVESKRFDLAPRNSTNRSWVLGTKNEQTDDGLACFLPLGTDVPAGSYHVTLTAEDFRDGYVMLYRTNPGYQPVRELNFQPRSVGRSRKVLLPANKLNRSAVRVEDEKSI